MPYESGTSANTTTLIAAIGAFAQGCGWTQHYLDSSHLIISRGGGFTTRFTAINTSQILVVGQAPYNSALPPASQSSQSATGSSAYSNGLLGPYAAVHFFGNASSNPDSYIHVVVQASSGVFRHLGCGGLRTFGEVTTAQYVFKTSATTSNYEAPFSNHYGDYSTQIRADSDGVSPRWLYSSTSDSNGRLDFMGGGSASSNLNIASAHTQRAVLNQFLPYAKRASGNSLLGIPPDIRSCSMLYLAPNEIITLGSDQWKVFPLVNRQGAFGQENSGYFGMAYKI